MKSREQIIAENRIEDVLAQRCSTELHGGGSEKKARCPFHDDKTASLTVNVDKQLWTCHACKIGGSVIDLLARIEGTNAIAILKKYGDDGSNKPLPPKPMQAAKIVAKYDYLNAKGELVYQVCRMEPKTFRQRRPDGGGWVWNMEGVERVLYQLPKVLKTHGAVWIVEGEKDADNITKLGPVATCNVGGAGKWLDAYTESLLGKEVVLCGDNDKPGKEHMDAILESLAGKVKSVRWVTVPKPHKDISDYLGKLPDDAELRFEQFNKLLDNAPLFDKGVNIPVQSMAEIELEYKQSLAKALTHSLDFTNWLPSLGKRVRPMIAGELISIIAGTAVGKTALAQNLALHAAPLKTLFFQMELPGSLTFERFAALATLVPCKSLYAAYKNNMQGQAEDWRATGKLDHIFTCQKTRLTADQIEELIIKSELKIGERPALVIVDYIQLMGGKGERRERVASAAEGLKAVAKSTGTIVVLLSQVSRKGKDAGAEVGLNDAKEAGEIENSAGLVLGAWRDEGDTTLLNLRILKNTKGFPGHTIPCNFDGERMLITERLVSAVADADVPPDKTYQSPYND